MAAYKTGRSRALTFSGTFSGYAWSWSSGHPPVLYGNTFGIRVNANWITDDATLLTAHASGLGLDCSATDGLGGTDSDTDATLITSRTLVSGSWEITISEVEEWVEYTEGAAPTYGGSAVDGDVPGEAATVLTARAPVGATLTATITIGGITATASTAFASPHTMNRYDVGVEVTGEGQLSAQDASAAWDWLGWQIGESYSHSDSSASISASGETCGLTTDASLGPDARVICTGSPPMSFALQGRLRADSGAYTGGGTVRYVRKNGEAYAETTPSGGTYSATYTQRQYSAGGDLNGVAQDTISLDEHNPTLYHWLVPASGEAANQWRLLIRGAYYDAGTIAQATTVAFDGGFTFGDGGTTRTWSPAKSLAGYRYLLVDTDQAAKDVTLTIGNKTWTVETDGSGIAVFDLCGPHNVATDTDARDSRWPIPTDVDYVDADGCMWGVVNVGSLTLTAEAGVTCTVAANGVYLSRDTWSTPPGHSLLNVVAPHLYWVPSGTANTYKRPLLRGDTDGKRSLEEADWTRVVGVPTVHTAETIEDVFDEVNASDSSVVRNVGWSAVIDTDIDVADGSAGETWMAPDWALMNRNRNASWIEGSGIAYVNGAWRYALDVDVSSAYTLVAQMLCDKVTIYPACGDVFGLRTGAHRWEYGTTDGERAIELRGGRYMRGVAWGLVLHTDGTPFDGATVTYKRTSDGAAGGSGSTDVRGEYLTGLPGGLAGETYTARAETGSEPFPSIEALAYGGLRRRCCFTGVPSSLGCIECDGPRQWLHVGFAKRIRTYNLWGWAVLWESSDYAIDHWLRLRTDPRRGLLLMLSDDGGGTLGLWVSHDGGNTGTEVDTMTASSAAIEVDSERAAYVLLWENGGNVQVQISGDGGATWSAAQNALYLGAAFSGTVVDMARDARRDVLLLALESGGAISIYGSQDLGLTWELVAS